jgi:hypothetical protein
MSGDCQEYAHFCMGNHFLSRPYFKTFDGDNADISITNVISHNTISGKQK